MSYKDISKHNALLQVNKQKQFAAEFGYLMSPIYVSQQKTTQSLIQEYGKEECIIRCDVMIAIYLNNIKQLKYYDSEQITAWENAIHYWQEVKTICSLFVSNLGT